MRRRENKIERLRTLLLREEGKAAWKKQREKDAREHAWQQHMAKLRVEAMHNIEQQRLIIVEGIDREPAPPSQTVVPANSTTVYTALLKKQKEIYQDASAHVGAPVRSAYFHHYLDKPLREDELERERDRQNPSRRNVTNKPVDQRSHYAPV